MTKTAAIIGGGVIGGGWAARFTLNGWDVKVYDPDPEAERKIGEVMTNARRALPMLVDQPMPEPGSMTLCSTLEEAATGAELIVEAVPERVEIKHKVYAQIEAVNTDGIIASSTSGIMPTDLQSQMAHPGRLIVAHPFNPVYLLPLVELVAGEKTDAQHIEAAKEIYSSLGMYPLHCRVEIEGFLSDRLQEALWREALWLLHDDVATADEIDAAIAYGPGLRWAQMGTMQTFHLAGGEGGMRAMLAMFGPCLKWPWTKLMDVPELTDDFVNKVGGQCETQAGDLGPRDLERIRDDNLIGIIRSLKQNNWGAGAVARAHSNALRPAMDDTKPLLTQNRVVPVDWTDINGHMNEGRYGQIFSDAAEEVMAHVGADEAYIEGGLSYFTVETTVKYIAETHAGERVHVYTTVTQGEGKKLRCFHEMKRASDGELMATCDQFMLHVSLETRRTCDPAPDVKAKVEALAALHASE
ncbi:carnitine 3-dehydrogenase [Roseovarius faecimaris]|uniref:L-carnitine dehydrogenase n=1 Tax=Roseovarius faecimaris TaxID=2494550 RepID=A0A6I6IQC7_9RHOB|nr:carnitine 3-dehydrogenase [Roseovarius faecimaris]QGX99380.1 carnitine 3-dehydrogenase [Roseovarius faecimaris]